MFVSFGTVELQFVQPKFGILESISVTISGVSPLNINLKYNERLHALSCLFLY